MPSVVLILVRHALMQLAAHGPCMGHVERPDTKLVLVKGTHAVLQLRGGLGTG